MNLEIGCPFFYIHKNTIERESKYYVIRDFFLKNSSVYLFFHILILVKSKVFMPKSGEEFS